nr:uncharacterized protein LOC117277192 [Nicotiana tomentosiformis]
MPRIPSTLRRRHRLIQVLRQHRTQNMKNLPPFPQQMENPPIIYVQPPPAQDYQPLSWMEMGLLGHAVSFNLQINCQETIAILQNTHYLAQLITEGMRLAMNNYLNQVWLNNILHPLAPSLNLYLVHAMRNQWNMTSHFNSIQPQNLLPDMSFFPPEMLSQLNPIFMPWENTQQAQEQPTPPMNQKPPPPQPHVVQEPKQEEAAMEEIGEPLNLGLEQIMEFSNLDGVKVYLFTEMQEKRHVLNCPLALYKCSMDIRPPQDPTVGNRAMILVPSIRRSHVFLEGMRENGDPENMNLNLTMNHPTNFSIWNIRGGNNDDFRRNFREMVDTHRPYMVTLLETRMVNHAQMLSDFGFSEMIEVPAEGQSGGMEVMWKHEVVIVHNFVRRNQEIHATIEVINAP